MENIEEFHYLDIQEAIKTLRKYRTNLFNLITSPEPITAFMEYQKESGRTTILEIKRQWTEEAKVSVLCEIKDTTDAIDALSVLDAFYNGSTIPWSYFPKDFFKILDLTCFAPRENKIEDYKLL